MVLRHQPFAASKQLLAVMRGAGPIGKGARGPGIKLLQSGLIELGYELARSTRNGVEPDGVFNSETCKAVASFQTAQAIRPDGRVGKITLSRIDALLAHKAATSHQQGESARPPSR
jgi:peptidoglycan hydrolase-like protein with peptidoglycan-binding domain